MARGKQAAKELTPEEKLEQALVPAEEQPHAVPGNWCWTYGNMVLEAMESQKPIGEGFSYIDIDAIDNQKQAVSNPKRLPVSEAPSRASRKLHAGDTVFSLVRPYLKNIAYIDDSLAHCIASTGFFVCTPKAFLNSRYLYQLMISPYMVDGLNQYLKGDNSPSIRKDDIERFPFPLPPLAEQSRMVARIESLFARLDEAKEKAQAVVDGFEPRKSAILHRAFTGELTAQWRKGHGLEPKHWINSPWGSFILSIEAGKNWSAEGRPPEDSEFGVVKVSAVTWGEFDELESKTCTLDEQWNEKTQIHTGDFLFSRANTLQLVGNCVIVKKIDRRLMLSDKILRLSFDKSVVPEYVLYFTRSDLYRKQIEQLASGNQDGMRNISQKNMKLVEFPVSSLSEQKEIVHILNNIFAREQQAKEAAEAVLAQIDTMKKAILARAFRGGLGTNDPAEEWAGKLLINL